MAMVKDAKGFRRFRTDLIMKKVLLFLLFFTTIVYSQQDTIQIKERDITYVHKEYPNEQENVLDFKHGTYYYALCKGPNERLEGFYKVIIDDYSFYTCLFDQGLKSPSKGNDNNIIKYYRKKQSDAKYEIYKLDIYFPIFITNNETYYTTDDFSCNNRKIIVRNVYTHSNQIFDTYQVKQKIKKKDIEWTFYKKSKGKFSFPKKNICDCP